MTPRSIRHHRRRYFGGLALLTALSVADVSAGDIQWTGNGADDLWGNPTNWSPAQVPTSDDKVRVVRPGTFTVTVDATAQARDLILGSGTNAPTLRVLNGSEMFLWGDTTFSSNSVIWLDAAILHVAGSSFPFPTLTNHGTIEWNSAWLDGGPVTIASAGVVNFNGSLSTGIAGEIHNFGTINWNSTGPLEVEGRLNNHATYNLYTNCDLTGDGSFINMGAITVPASIGTVTFTPACWFTNTAGGFVVETNSTLQLTPGSWEQRFFLGHGTVFTGPGVVRIDNPEFWPIHWDGITYFNYTVEMQGSLVTGKPLLVGTGSFPSVQRWI